jgi:hypothetical protein
MNNEVSMLINLDHVISVKPIRIMTRGGVIEGYWIRATNNKKYRAISIPQELKVELNKTVSVSSAPIEEEVHSYEQ